MILITIQPLCLLILHFWNEHLERVFVDPRQKISTDKSRQTSIFSGIIWNSTKFSKSFEMCESSFEHLLTNLSLPINGLLEMWFRLLTFYIRSLNCSKKIFFSSSLVNNARSKQKIVDAGLFFFSAFHHKSPSRKQNAELWWGTLKTVILQINVLM